MTDKCGRVHSSLARRFALYYITHSFREASTFYSTATKFEDRLSKSGGSSVTEVRKMIQFFFFLN